MSQRFDQDPDRFNRDRFNPGEHPRTYVIILNWNGWKDTVKCLESVFQLEYLNLRIVVCDNGSVDGSVDKMKAWADGLLPRISNRMSTGSEALVASCKLPFTAQTISKPISYRVLTREQSESKVPSEDTQLVIIQNHENLGFAGGNNVGLRYACRDPECQFLWLLNNDTLVEAGALSALIAKASTDSQIGAVSSICYFASDPTKVEAWGGAQVNLWIGFARNSREPHEDTWFDALYGASMLIRRATLESAGLLDEGFFLYWDETEFCLRIRKLGWRLAAASTSRVLHRVNASTGGNMMVIDRYFTASGLRILRLHSKAPHLAMVLFLAIRVVRRIFKFEFRRLKSVGAGVLDYHRRRPTTPRIS